MANIDEILSLDIDKAIEQLRAKSVSVPNWQGNLEDQYEASKHKIMNEALFPNKRKKDGTPILRARVPVGLQKLATKRMTEFMCAIPVQRRYQVSDSSGEEEITKAMERIYSRVRINTANVARLRSYFGACEVATVWYITEVDKPHNLYGFPCKYKLRLRTFSPMTGDKLYPLFDEHGDMIALSFEYQQQSGETKITYFETFTNELRIVWMKLGDKWELMESISHDLGKIPGVYMNRSTPIWEDKTSTVEELEALISRNLDTLAYNSAPITVFKGLKKVEGEEKGDSNRIYATEVGGGVEIASWDQAAASLEFQVDTLIRIFFMELQFPDFSQYAKNGVGGALSGESRRLLLTDAHLKVGDEQGPCLEFWDREVSVLKSILAIINPSWAALLEDIDVENVVTPFVMNDDKENISNGARLYEAGGCSLRTFVEMANQAADVEAEMKRIAEEEEAKLDRQFRSETL